MLTVHGARRLGSTQFDQVEVHFAFAELVYRWLCLSLVQVMQMSLLLDVTPFAAALDALASCGVQMLPQHRGPSKCCDCSMKDGQGAMTPHLLMPAVRSNYIRSKHAVQMR